MYATIPILEVIHFGIIELRDKAGDKLTIDIIQKLATQYGLFVALVVYVIWDSRLREVKYIRIIDDLSRKFGVITDIKKEVYYIKRSIEKINRG